MTADDLLDERTLEYLLRGADEGEIGRVFGAAYSVLADLTGAHRQVRAALAGRPNLTASVPHQHPAHGVCVQCALSDAAITPVSRALLLSLYALRDATEDWNLASSPSRVEARMRSLDPDEKGLHAMFGPRWFDVVRTALDFESMTPGERGRFVRTYNRGRVEVSVAVSWLTIHVCKRIRDVTHRRAAERAVSARMADLQTGVAGDLPGGISTAA